MSRKYGVLRRVVSWLVGRVLGACRYCSERLSGAPGAVLAIPRSALRGWTGLISLGGEGGGGGDWGATLHARGWVHTVGGGVSEERSETDRE